MADNGNYILHGKIYFINAFELSIKWKLLYLSIVHKKPTIFTAITIDLYDNIICRIEKGYAGICGHQKGNMERNKKLWEP